MIEEVERVSAEHELPGLPDFELLRYAQVNVDGAGHLK